MNVLLDINVVLDVFLNRVSWLADSAAVLQANHDGRISASLSAATLPTIFYIVRRSGGQSPADRAIDECLNSFNIVPVVRSTIELARTLPGSDFEDNLQIASAIESHADAIVTRDTRGFASSPIPVLLPAQLLTQLPRGPQTSTP